MPRDVLEAARTDGATEWQVFRRVTVPLLAPVLSVVFITMIINVLKVFDIVIALAPESTQANANVIALAMWRTAFGGVNDFGVGSAIAVFLFLLVDPRARAEHPPLQEGACDVAAVARRRRATRTAARASPRRSCAASPRRRSNRARRASALLWLVPTIGLFITSILPASALGLEGLVADLLASRASRPGRTTTRCSTTTGWSHALKTTAYIAVGNTLLVVVIGAMAGYAFAWLDFPGRDWVFIGVIGLLVVPLQMALIPMFWLYDKFGIFDTVIGIVLFHAAFGLPFAIFLLRNFFVGIPKDILESARIDGA